MTDASAVKRWYVDEWSACREANDGPFVKYTDYAALEAEKLLMHEEAEEVASQTLQRFEQMERERENDSIDYAQSYQLLTADLSLTQSRLESVQESNALITRDWQEEYAKRQTAVAELANLNTMHQQLEAVLHDDDMPTFVPVANVVEDVMQMRADLDELKLRLKMEAECHEQTVADLERARAEVERLRRIKCEAVGAFNEAAKENERLKAALVKLIEKAEDVEVWVDNFRNPDPTNPRRTKNFIAHEIACAAELLREPIAEAQAALKETP